MNSRKGARRVTRARLLLSRDAARRSPCDGGLLDQRTDVRGVPGLCLVRRLSPAWVAGALLWTVVTTSSAYLTVLLWSFPLVEGERGGLRHRRHHQRCRRRR